LKLDDGGWLVTPTNAFARLTRSGAGCRARRRRQADLRRCPTKEVPLHTALYQTREPARAVVHLHSTHSVALSMLPELRSPRRAAR